MRKFATSNSPVRNSFLAFSFIFASATAFLATFSFGAFLGFVDLALGSTVAASAPMFSCALFAAFFAVAFFAAAFFAVGREAASSSSTVSKGTASERIVTEICTYSPSHPSTDYQPCPCQHPWHLLHRQKIPLRRKHSRSHQRPRLELLRRYRGSCRPRFLPQALLKLRWG